MGWMRCTYRNCTVTSGKKTHMFHYPVFDKVRCHQWLVNAKRLDMLNLTVSQLRNKSICEHHFEDHFFMNPMKGKLKQSAIPTLDGPHCPASEELAEIENEAGFNFSVDLIDNNDTPTLFTDRIANYSTKYGDFLTNCEIMDDENFSFVHHKKPKSATKTISNYSEKLSTDIKRVLNPRMSREPQYAEIELKPLQEEQVKTKVFVKTEDLGLIEQKPLCFEEGKAQVPQESSNQADVQQQASGHSINELNLPLPSSPKTTNSIRINNPRSLLYVKNSKRHSDSQSKVKILSVKTICPGDPNNSFTSFNTTNNEMPPQPLDQTTITQSSIDNSQSHDLIKQKNEASKTSAQENSTTLPMQEKSPTKRKLPMSKVSESPRLKSLKSSDEAAKIQEKRKFNMKLGDIIKNSVNQLNKESFEDSLKMFKANNASKSQTENKLLSMKSTIPSENNQISGSHQFVITYLEARMKKMEDLLLNRIDNNTQRINELKSSLSKSKESELEEECKPSVATRGRGKKADESHKKNLYKEISQFLTPETNSMVYEELFINKVVESVPRYSKREKSKVAP